MTEPKDTPPGESQPSSVTYVVVVHGVGEQRKNECVINVVNRFAEARRGAGAEDNRDVLTLGQASGQTGFSKVPGTEQPWLEFGGIPASCDHAGGPFLGEPSPNGKNLRFVDLCWSDVMQDSIEHVGQDADVWAKGLLGRVLRKHKAAAGNRNAQVPLWIRRVLYLLADTLLLVRFAMNFRFKEMKELVFVKFLGDVQLYGEYSRCRGRAVRRFHEVMRSIEDAHKKAEEGSSSPRVARYIIIAHSLGSIMSFDALLYASATRNVRRACISQWKFPGYLGNDDKACESDGLDELDELRPENSRLSEEEKLCNDTGWIDRVESFVTLGSPIDKYLMIWWSNYRYLLECDDHIQSRCPKIAHFNYCDELDPVGHNLDIVQQTAGYRKVFKCREDVAFQPIPRPGGRAQQVLDGSGPVPTDSGFGSGRGGRVHRVHRQVHAMVQAQSVLDVAVRALHLGTLADAARCFRFADVGVPGSRVADRGGRCCGLLVPGAFRAPPHRPQHLVATDRAEEVEAPSSRFLRPEHTAFRGVDLPRPGCRRSLRMVGSGHTGVSCAGRVSSARVL